MTKPRLTAAEIGAFEKMAYSDKYGSEIVEIVTHISKVRNASLKRFLWILLLLSAMYLERGKDELVLPPPKKSGKRWDDFVLFTIPNIRHLSRFKNIPTISARTAYDIQHAYASVHKTNELSNKIFYDLLAAAPPTVCHNTTPQEGSP